VVNIGSFFLKPGESLEKGVQPAYLLSEHQAVLLRSIVSYVDTNDPAHPTGKARTPGETWMVFGPTLYIPTVEVEVLETRKSIALDEQEGFVSCSFFLLLLFFLLNIE